MENGGGKDRKLGSQAPRAHPRPDARARPADRPHRAAHRALPSASSPRRSTAACRRSARWAPCSAASTSSSAPPGASRTSSSRVASTSREVTITVLDEADHMCDLGFLEPVQRILRRHRADGGQKLLFSRHPRQGCREPRRRVPRRPGRARGRRRRPGVLHDRPPRAADRAPRQGRHHRAARDRARQDPRLRPHPRLRRACSPTSSKTPASPPTSLHGDLNQSRRTRNLELLTSGRVNVLVATDVAARGIHVDDIELVVQADAPDEYKTYLHRSGRTGRAGKIGTVVTLITRQPPPPDGRAARPRRDRGRVRRRRPRRPARRGHRHRVVLTASGTPAEFTLGGRSRVRGRPRALEWPRGTPCRTCRGRGHVPAEGWGQGVRG